MFLHIQLVLILPIFVEAIFGGREVTDPHKYPWLVRICSEKGWKTFSCGGSVISKNVILTAAHCVDGASSIWIKMGHSNTASNEIDVSRVKSVLIHPGVGPGISWV